jgi:predicted helicase
MMHHNRDMATTSSEAFERLLDTLFYGGLDQRDKGDKFERLMRSYLLTDPEWASQFSDVWLWKDYPGRDGRIDTGIDLVAQAKHTGELTAIQCKFIDPETTVSKQHLDSFIADSSRREFSRRLFVSTSVKWGKNAEDAIRDLDPPLTRLNFYDLAASSIDWTQFSLETPEQITRKDGRKTLRPHQSQALEAVREGFHHSDRGKMIMACGTGKTFTSLQIMEELTPKNSTVLFLVPSIALLSQTLREWKHDASKDFHALAVCSDVKVGKNTDEDVSTTDLIIPATTDPQKLLASRKKAADHGGRTVVFSTYQSIEVIAQAQDQGFEEFDLIICDEAHRTTGATLAGKDESAFIRVHDNSFVRGSKRLYMTATPKVFDERAKAKADENSVAVVSMDEERRFGPEFYYLGFGEAVEKNLLADYKVLVLAVDENAVNEQLQNLLTDEEGELSINDVARLVGCWNGLATRGTEGTNDNTATSVRPMQRAVAFASNIRESQRVARVLPSVTEELAQDSRYDLVVDADHVDGAMNVALRNQKLAWLEDTPEPGTCRILSNARCLSEGVDVPSLDAVLFLNPRNSQVDVVQSVGRVMRKAPGKDYGYIILPVGIPTGMEPEQALKDSKRYKVIWSVLNALRSHDDRFEAMINKIDLNERRDDKLQIIGVGTGSDDDDTAQLNTNGVQGAFTFDFEGLDQWRDAIYAKIVQKVGDREYWENWSKTIADVAARHTNRIRALVTQDPAQHIETAFATFTEALKANLNEGITSEDAISMLSQHLITKPVFDALFEGYNFAAHNPVSQVMETMVQTLEGNNLSSETEELNDFYASVARRASGIENPEGKQRIITELYENFFKQAFPKQAEALGVVYTPIEIVDFIIRAVDELSRKHFGTSLSDEGVHILDPFTGTGTFIVRLLESGVITPHDLARKYTQELHANEIMLLAYYIAAINIEATYHGLQGGSYEPFQGIVLADTFQMSEDGDTLDTEVFTTNNKRAVRQLDTDIRIIVGNPPYSVGQSSANDDNANQSYPTLDHRIKKTYAKDATGQNLNSLYDLYIRAIRWGTDRIGDKGILAYVTNGAYIDSNTANGLRKHLVEDFSHLYIYNLRGNALGSGEIRKREAGNVFGHGTRTTVAIMLGVKNPTHTAPAQLSYRDIGDYLTREEKLSIIKQSTTADSSWKTIVPSLKHEWLNQSSETFDTFAPLGDRKGESGRAPIFNTFSRGVATGRDAWAYSFSRNRLQDNAKRFINAYNANVETFQPTSNTAAELLAEAKKHATYDSTQVAWNADALKDLSRQVLYEYSSAYIRQSLYRPFTKQYLYFDRTLISRRYQLPHMFPTKDHENYGFSIVGTGFNVPFSCLATDAIPDLQVLGNSQFFPRYSYRKLDEKQPDLLSADNVIDGFLREDNISDDALARYQKAFGKDVSKDEIFDSIYALLHSVQYREAYAVDLKRQLPRIPLPDTTEDFKAFARAGKRLRILHTKYESVAPYNLEEQHSSASEDDPTYYRVKKLRWGGNTRNPDKSKIVYNENLTLLGIPDVAHEYRLGSRSALEWILDRYQVTTHKASGIVNDPNDWPEVHGSPQYIVDLIKRVVTVSVETIQITRTLPELPNL